MPRMRYFIFLFLSSLIALPLSAQEHTIYSKHHTIQWKQADTLYMPGHETLNRLYFDGATYGAEPNQVPWFYEAFAVYDQNLQLTPLVDSLVVEPLTPDFLRLLNGFKPDTVFQTRLNIGKARNDILSGIHILPLRTNPQTGMIERLLSFRLNVELELSPFVLQLDQKQFIENSVLSTGNWFKFKSNQTGVHRITYSDLQQMGLNPGSVDPRNIRIYGNGGGILPESNAAFRHEDLVENPIIVFGEGDGSFDLNDEIVFYGRGPVTWQYNELTQYFEHQNNFYDDYTYFFLTTDLGPGKRMQAMSPPSAEPTNIITDFLDYQVYEKDIYNLINMGRTWYGDIFDFNLLQQFDFTFMDIITSKPVFVKSEVASRNLNPAGFQWLYNDQPQATISFGMVSQTGYEFAKAGIAQFELSPDTENITISLKYNRTASTSRGWLDYISVNAWRQLRFGGQQLLFRNPEAIGGNKVNEYRLANAPQQLTVWDVTDPVNPLLVNTTQSANTKSWRSQGEVLREYLAFDGSSYYPIEFVEQLPNQNLHALRNIDYLILTTDEFMVEAERLANIHRNQSNFTVFVTTPQKVYNEFSSGGQDISAIRDFVRRLYQSSDPGKQIRYLLLFGDASFDYKDRIGGNTNFVPTWQSMSSLHTVWSIATDDFYGYLDDGEGGGAANLLDIGIGRLPVATAEQAAQMVDKVLSYLRKDIKTMKPWRTFVSFVADDDDGNLHLSDAETLSQLLDSAYPALNIDKIYLDAYEQIATSAGQRAPQVNEAITRRIEKGSLIINYSGHGGEVGWGSEQFLQIADINTWRNTDKLPVFITATCEFSRYDDAERTSAGELVILNPFGGAIAMFTTARATFASANLALNKAVFNNNMFQKVNGEYPRFGDIIRNAKLNGNANDRKFVLLGDPALQMAYPTEQVVTTHINGRAVGSRQDTIRGLDMVTIAGQITDDEGNLHSGFNGVVYPTVFDKKSELVTKGDEDGFEQAFTMRRSVIYQGKASVVNGHFEFSFLVPRDIAYNYGPGRISYYATNYELDALGFYEGILIGGFNENAVADERGPEIRLFMNDTTFKSGDITDERPVMLALVSDESGINTTGAGIGHDIVATITGETELSAIVNDFYSADLDKSTSGTIAYPFFGLNEGPHNLRLKVWDVFNNSNQADIDFVVVNSAQMAIDQLMNYPNPFNFETFFIFEHNQAGRALEVEIQIFNLNGKLVHSLFEKITPESYRSTPIRWDASSNSGYKITGGLYVYRLLVTNERGEKNELRSKFIFHQ
jgi:hypothetical protein